MADSSVPLDDLLDLKMLPAWVSESAPAERYAHIDGEDRPREHGRDRRPGRGKPRGPGGERRAPRSGEDRRPQDRDRNRGPRRGKDRGGFAQRHDRGAKPEHRPPPVERAPLKVEVKFLPRVAALENVTAQIKENAFAYSLNALARLFLAKPERYEVQLTAQAETPLFQLGDHGAISSNRELLERSAFRFAEKDFYKIDITESEPIKGNFTSIARDRLSGTILGPTNHHDYQKKLRGLYEQRFSRRMKFADYQRQIEIVTDPEVVEKWKEDARKITTYSTVKEETPATFPSAAEAERHFREKYLPGLVRAVTELSIDGLTSRNLGDRALYRLVEDAWTNETRSPSKMMQELATRFRESGLHVFRHRRGMLFVSPVRTKPLVKDQEGVAMSPSVKSIIETLTAHPKTNRKDLADKILANLTGEELEKAKLVLAADLHWLISEGHVIEFNDGSLDLPRVKVKQPQKEEIAVEAAVSAAQNSRTEEPLAGAETSAVPSGENPNPDVAAAVLAAPEPGEGGSAIENSSTPIEAEIGGS